MHEDELLRHLEPAAEEVDVRHGEPERLALAKPGAGGDRDERVVAIGYFGRGSEDLLGLERDGAFAFELRERDPLARAHRAMSRSATAERKIDARWRYTTSTDDGLSRVERSLTKAWISERRIDPSSRSSNRGRTWMRKCESTCCSVVGR